MKLNALLIAGLCAAILALNAPARAAPAEPPTAESGVLRVKSAYGLRETIERIKADVAAKKIQFFNEIDQSALASSANIQLRPSVLLTFGNPPLGLQFLTANPYAALDWPVRMVVFQDEGGTVWFAYTDFAYIGRRHHLDDRAAALAMASQVSGTIAASVAAR